jgi:hypothetical protein
VRGGGLWAKHVVLKQGVIGNTFGEHIENMPWEHRKHIGNLMGTHWKFDGNKGKMKKILFPSQNLKEKKSRHFECMLSLPINYMKFLFSKLFVTISSLG